MHLLIHADLGVKVNDADFRRATFRNPADCRKADRMMPSKITVIAPDEKT